MFIYSSMPTKDDVLISSLQSIVIINVVTANCYSWLAGWLADWVQIRASDVPPGDDVSFEVPASPHFPQRENAKSLS